MPTNPADHLKPGEWNPLPVIPADVQPKPDRVYSRRERLLVIFAVITAVLCDRLLLRTLWEEADHLPFFSAVFWLCFLAGFCAFFWKRLAPNKALWVVAGLTAALCCWNFIFDYRSAFGALTMLVIPAVLMAYTQLFAGDYKLKDAGALAFAWLEGWIARPFLSIPNLFGAVSSAVSGGKKQNAVKVLIALAVTLPVLMVIIPLLSVADRVFRFYLNEMLGSLDLESFLPHFMAVIIATMLFYSFLWQCGFAEKAKPASKKAAVRFDLLVSCMVLGAVVAVYLLFCTVQFTYLFAGAGLPGGMSYSDYAREGFAQIIAICTINLLLFGFFFQYGKKHRGLTAMLYILLGVTAVMLVSGFLRLRLYISAYGMTWLRLLSAWFLLYLGIVLLLCALRTVWEKLPLIAVCAFVLLGWYALLGYSNPDALIVSYNLQSSGDPSGWLRENRYYVGALSDDALLELTGSGADPALVGELLAENPEGGYSLASARLR
jgi:hypothetical protein